MPYKRFDNLKDEKKKRIFEVALEEFAENSFSLASINIISKKAKLSAGSLYYYFEDKQDLFYTLLNHTSQEFLNGIGEIDKLFEQYGYWNGIREIIKKRLDYEKNNPKVMQLINRLLLTDDEIEQKGRNKLMAAFHMIFNYGYDNGFIRTDLPREYLFEVHFGLVMTTNQFMVRNIASHNQSGNKAEEFLEKAMDIIQNAMSRKER